MVELAVTEGNLGEKQLMVEGQAREPGLVNTAPEKARVAEFWNDKPCGSGLAEGAPLGTSEFFERTEAARFTREPFVRRFAKFEEWSGKKVLEVGCGTGTDLSMFARNGAETWAIDLTPNGAALASQRLRYHKAQPRVFVGDCERLPFRNDSFDLVYS